MVREQDCQEAGFAPRGALGAPPGSAMPRKYFRKFLPDHQTVVANRWLAKFGTLLHHPALWHLNRRSVSGGVAIGLFAGLVPGPLQMLTAAALAIPLKVNLPVALIVTLYTNPFTIVPLYLVALWIGQLLTGAAGAEVAPAPDFRWTGMWSWMREMMEWASGMGVPLLVGLVTLALSLAALGWIAVQVGWRAWVLMEWRKRRLRRARPPAS
jgi:hypothetical protein